MLVEVYNRVAIINEYTGKVRVLPSDNVCVEKTEKVEKELNSKLVLSDEEYRGFSTREKAERDREQERETSFLREETPAVCER